MVREVRFRYLKDAAGKDTDVVCVHWFIVDAAGPIRTAGIKTPLGLVGGVVGRIACNPSQTSVSTRERNGLYYPCAHSDDVRAATCPDCLKTPEAVALLAHYEEEAKKAGA